ncbi:MAG: hypothetical protein ACE5KO_00990 [Candidatus Bathyarchaeia archaeon]
MPSGPIDANELKFMHERRRLRALSPLPLINVCDETIGPVEKGSEIESSQWVAEELARNQLAIILESQEPLGLTELQRIQLRENIQASRRLSNLSNDFYPQLKRYMSQLNSESEPRKIVEFQKAQKLAVDILTSRMYKILLIASAAEDSIAVTQNLTPEEAELQRTIYQLVNDWKTKITMSWEPRT